MFQQRLAIIPRFACQIRQRTPRQRPRLALRRQQSQAAIHMAIYHLYLKIQLVWLNPNLMRRSTKRITTMTTITVSKKCLTSNHQRKKSRVLKRKQKPDEDASNPCRTTTRKQRLKWAR